MGCGVGNTIFPVLEENPHIAHLIGVDFSPRAIDLVRSHPQYDAQKCTALVCDVAKENLPSEAKDIDYIVLIFVLSAISPDFMPHIISEISRVLKEGGVVLIRDYAEGDMAQIRFDKDPKRKKIDDSFYVRLGRGLCSFSICIYFLVLGEMELVLIFLLQV